MFYRLGSKAITLGLSFIITFFPVYLMFKLIKIVFDLMLKAAKVLVKAVYKMMLNYQI